MAISDEQFVSAIKAVSAVEGIYMDPNDLADDVFLLSYAWPDSEDFEPAVANTCRALSQIAGNIVCGTPLEGRYAEWRSFHYQHKRAQGAKADMRIIFQRRDGSIIVKGFGHRYIPADIYSRLSQTR